MSIMAACWRLTLPPTAKSVLMSLADQAKDDALCWPSISKTAERTCFSERAVQGAIQWLVKNGLLEAKVRPGRSTMYRIVVAVPELKPRISQGAQEMRPSSEAGAPTPAATAPDPSTSCTQNRKEPSKNRKEPKKNVSHGGQVLNIDDLIAEGVERQHALDWLLVRKGKRAPLTPTAWAEMKAQAGKAGITIGEAVRIAASRSWQSFNASWLDRRESNSTRAPRECLSDQSARLNREHELREGQRDDRYLAS